MRTDQELIEAIEDLNTRGHIHHPAFFREGEVARILFLLAEGAAHCPHSKMIEDQHRVLIRLRERFDEQQAAQE